MVAEPPPGGGLSDEEWANLVTLLARFAANDLDQFSNWQVDTPFGPVFIEVSRKPPPVLTNEAFTRLWPPT
jgi:hypothetical protein